MPLLPHHLPWFMVAGLFSGILLGDRRAHTRRRADAIAVATRPASLA